MRAQTQIHLFGSLKKKLGDLYDFPIQLDLKSPTSLGDILIILKIPPDIVQLAMLNNRSVTKDSTIHPGDRLSLFPKEYPIFVDWKDHRF